jgi:hypothetical protein
LGGRGEEHVLYIQILSALNLSYITSKFCTTGMYVTLDLQTILHTGFVDNGYDVFI